MIVYRKSPQLRLRRVPVPQPPFWGRTLIIPYSARRAAPVAIDYAELRASAADRLEVSVCDRVQEELDRAAARISSPVLIEATEFAESIFRRGDQVLAFCGQHGLPAIYLTSTRGVLPQTDLAEVTTVIAAWPLEFHRLEPLFSAAGGTWGVTVPVIFPATTHLSALEELAAMARSHGASFFAAVPLVLEPTAKQALARSLALEDDRETYNMLFHSNLEPVHVATERHIAALAAEGGMRDFVVPPRFDERSNWNASIVLTLTATRMLAMAHEIELAALLARSARAVAELDKPLARIGEAASLSIVETLDAVSVDLLTEWLENAEPAFVRRINERWRLRRDAGGRE